jgi:ribonuclease J
VRGSGDIELNTSDKSFSVVALGGLSEIGMNCLVVEVANRLLLIDCGAMFSSEEMGVDIIHPGFSYLNERRDDIEGLVLTHAHEDHIAGAPFLLREADVPVYGGPYALGLLESKMRDFTSPPKLDAREFLPGGSAKLGPFSVTSFSMPHSIIENTGLLIDTPAGNLLHTGDFKLRLESQNQGRDILSKLAEMGERDVDLMLADSTGSEEEKISGEESEVGKALDRLVSETPGRVYVAIFASNIRRLEMICQVAKQRGRQVSLCGRSVHNHFEVASRNGKLAVPAGLVVPLEKVNEIERHRSLVVVSGTQGEMRSALGRLANANHHILRIDQDDLVVLSSRFIPGNELAIGRIIDRLHLLGARVVHRGLQSDVHVSGHGSRIEIRKAIETVAPRCFVPVHGTLRHLVACSNLAKDAKVKDIVVASNGDMVSCAPDGLSVQRGHVRTRRVFIDGDSGLNETVIKDRRILGSHGVLIVTLALDEDGTISRPINIIARGVTTEEALPWLVENTRDKVHSVVEEMDSKDRQDRETCGELVRAALRKHIRKEMSREPYVLVSILANTSV